MSDLRTRKGYVWGGLIGIWWIVVQLLCPLATRHTDANAHDLNGICVVGFCLGIMVAGIIRRTKPRPWYRWIIGALILALLIVVWPLLGSRTWAQSVVDIEQHAGLSFTCLALSALPGMALIYVSTWVTSKLWPPSSTPNQN